MVQTTNYEITTDIESSQLPTVAPVEVGTATLGTHAINMDYLGSIGSGIKNKLNATSAPTINDDSGDGYSVGSLWCDVTNDKIYMAIDVTLGAAIWQEYGGPFIGLKEIPTGIINGINKDFTISGVLIDGTIVVFINGIAIKKSNYSFAHPIITLSFAPVLGQTVEVYYLTDGTSATKQLNASNLVIHNYTLTPGDISAKQITLPSTPAVVTNTIVDVRGGTSQVYGVDFIISGAVLDWDGYDLEGQLIAGNILRIQYYI